MSVIAGLQDFRQVGPPADVGTYLFPESALIFRYTFAGTRYIGSVRGGERGWILIAYDVDANAATVLQTTINDANVGKIYLPYTPSGDPIILSATITIHGRLHIEGMSVTATMLQLADGVNGNMFEFTGTTSNLFFTLKHVYCDGNKDNNTAGWGFYVNPTDTGSFLDVTIRNVWFADFVDGGICTYIFWGWILDNVLCEGNDGNGFDIRGDTGKIVHCQGIKNGGHGLKLGDTGEDKAALYIFVADSNFEECGEHGVNIELSRFSGFVNVLSRLNDKHGFYIHGDGDNQFIGCKAIYNSLETGEPNTYDGFHLTFRADRCVFVGCIADGLDGTKQRYGFNVSADGCVDVIIDDYKAYNNATGEINDVGTRTRINGLGREAAGGAAPGAANWSFGDIVQDTDNPANHWIKDYDGVMRQIA